MFWKAYVDLRESLELSIVPMGLEKRTVVARREGNARSSSAVVRAYSDYVIHGLGRDGSVEIVSIDLGYSRVEF